MCHPHVFLSPLPRPRAGILAALLLAVIPDCAARSTSMTIPADFPVFRVPGHETDMATVRELYWLHHPRSGPKATLWDEWLPSASLWPAMTSGTQGNLMRGRWRKALSSRFIDAEGYVATHQHASIAHQTGWPFPAWHQGRRGFGWHFSFKDVPGPPWRPDDMNTTEGWTLSGARDAGLDEDGWNLTLDAPGAVATAPATSQTVHPFEAPFVQIRWSARGLGPGARPYVEWATADEPAFSRERRMYFAPPAKEEKTVYAMVPVHRHPRWTGEITRLRIGFGNERPGAEVNLQAFFAQYDTRHNVNNFVYPIGCATYFAWTGDLNFLRENIQRMRMALRYGMSEFRTQEEKVVHTAWVGHDGRTGVERHPDGSPDPVTGRGIGNNYWDLLPFGHKDTYATIRLYHALNVMADLERLIREHPEWNIPAGFLALDPEALLRHAVEVKEAGNRLFWNEETGRYVICVDSRGHRPDYGLTFLNLEAIHYGFATPERAASILSWIAGEREVPGDTSRAADIYNWRFGPRTTTKRNLDYYMWVWHGAESIPFGGQVQDGGAVLGFSYHDLMARLKVRGPDDAWARLREVLAWFREVQAAGGYRVYYDGSREGTLQGGGTAGGLGLDEEFFESVLVPQVMLDGFLGFTPHGDGLTLNPRLPKDWPELSIDRIHFHDLVLSVTATHDRVEIRRQDGQSEEPWYVRLPDGEWKAERLGGEGADAPELETPAPLRRRESDGAFEVLFAGMDGVRFLRAQ